MQITINHKVETKIVLCFLCWSAGKLEHLRYLRLPWASALDLPQIGVDALFGAL